MENSVNKNPPEEVSRKTPLYLSIKHGRLETCKLIIEHLNDKNPLYRGESALQQAMWQKLFERHEDMYYCMETTLMSLDIKYHPNFDLKDENHIKSRKEHQENCMLCLRKILGQE